MEFDISCSYNSNMTLFVVEHFEISNLVYALLMYEEYLSLSHRIFSREFIYFYMQNKIFCQS